MRSRFAFISSIPTAPQKKKHLEVGWKRKAHKQALVRIETPLRDPRDHPRNLKNFF